jgi:site-specific DNA-methyltransferase (adenine-specific)
MITITNEDNMELMKRYEDNYFDLAIVDPPYGIDIDKRQDSLAGKQIGNNGGKYKKYHKTDWDSNVPTNEYFNELKRVSKEQIIWGGNYFFNVNLTGVIIWNKGANGIFKEGEMAKTSINTFAIHCISRADAYINKCDSKIHPTQKPTQLYEWLLMNYAKKGNKILDTHLGSGSIALACHNLGYNLTACELDPTYYNNALKRLKNHQNQLTMF